MTLVWIPIQTNQPKTLFFLRKLGEFDYGLGFIGYQKKIHSKNFRDDNGILVMWEIIHIFFGDMYGSI